jgi:hypothetical protein
VDPGHLLNCVCKNCSCATYHKLVKLLVHHSTGVPSIVILGVTLLAAENWRDARQSRRGAAGGQRRGISCLLTPAACLKGTLVAAFMAWTALRLVRGDILITIDEDHTIFRMWYLTGMAVRQALWTIAYATAYATMHVGDMPGLQPCKVRDPQHMH